RRPNTIRMRVEDTLARLGHAPTIAMEADGVDAILGLVADGVGHALLSANAVRTAAQPLRYLTRSIAPPGVVVRVMLATLPHRPRSQPQRSFVAVGRSGLPSALDLGRAQRDGHPAFWL